MKTMCLILTIILVLLFGSSAIADGLWVNPGMGGGSGGLSGGINISVPVSKVLFSIRLMHSNKDAFAIFQPNPSRTITEISAMAGIVNIGPRGSSASVSAGIGHVAFVKRGDRIDTGRLFDINYKKVTESAFGLALQVQLFPARRIGILGFANFNNVETLAGGILSYRFGSW